MICHVDFTLHYFVISVYSCMMTRVYFCMLVYSFLFLWHYVNNKKSTDVAVLLSTDEVNARFEIARFRHRN